MKNSTYLPALTPTAVFPLVLKQEFTPPPGRFTRPVRLSNKRQTLKRELGGVAETDTPATYPSSIWLLRLMEVVNRFLEAVPGRGY